MSSFFTPRSRKQQRMAKVQLVALTAALLLALVVLPVSADHEDEVEYTAAYEAAVGEFDAGSARLAALGDYYAARSLEAGYAASTARYEALAAHYDQAGGVVVAQDAEMLARNPELRFISATADSDYLARNPELKSFAASTDSDFFARNPEAKYASGWGGGSAATTESDFLAENPETKYAGGSSDNPELSAFERYCGC